MTSSELAPVRAATASRTPAAAILDFCGQVHAVTAAEFRKLRHDPLELALRAVQPMLWLLLFGQVMAQIRGLSGSSLDYLDFLSAGILAQSVASGGGLAVLPSGAVFAGSTQANPTGAASGAVSVTTQGTITASGALRLREMAAM